MVMKKRYACPEVTVVEVMVENLIASSFNEPSDEKDDLDISEEEFPGWEFN